MRSLLIPLVVVVTIGPTLFASAASILVLVANGSDITINLTGENSNNRLLNVVSNSGNNNPSILDWVGGNGANKAPSVSIEGANGENRSGGNGSSGGAALSALIDALWKSERDFRSSTADGGSVEDDDGNSGERDETNRTNGPDGTQTSKTTEALGTSSKSSLKLPDNATTPVYSVFRASTA